MDQQLKARLIGAVILVAIAVLLIPELLSGRRAAAPETVAEGEARGTRTYTIDLGSALPEPGSVDPAQVGATPPPALPKPEPRQQPAQAEPEPTGAMPAAASTTAQQASAPPAPPVPEPVAPVAKGGWSVQVGAFGSAATANKLVADLKGAGYQAYLSPVTRAGKTLLRVRVGPEAVRPDADKLASLLKARGLPATVVAND